MCVWLYGNVLPYSLVHVLDLVLKAYTELFASRRLVTSARRVGSSRQLVTSARHVQLYNILFTPINAMVVCILSRLRIGDLVSKSVHIGNLVSKSLHRHNITLLRSRRPIE